MKAIDAIDFLPAALGGERHGEETTRGSPGTSSAPMRSR